MGLERWLSGQEDLGSILSTHEECNALSVPCRHCKHMINRHTCRHNTYTKIKANLKKFEKQQLF